MSDELRRVVVSSRRTGTSEIVSDGQPADSRGSIEGYGPARATICEIRGPADHGDPADDAPRYPTRGVVRVVRIVFPAGYGVSDPGMHQTPTVDVACVLQGEIDLVLDAETTTLKQGEFVVLDGDVHGWRNTQAEPCVILGTMYGAVEPSASSD